MGNSSGKSNDNSNNPNNPNNDNSNKKTKHYNQICKRCYVGTILNDECDRCDNKGSGFLYK